MTERGVPPHLAPRSHAANVRSHPLAALLYGFSVHLCLPSGLSAPDGEGLGTLGLPAVSVRPGRQAATLHA